MFASAESQAHRVSKARFDALEPSLRHRLLQAHLRLRGQPRQVLVVVSGADGAGKGELVHRLTEWLEPRGVETQAFWHLTDEDAAHPHFWRYWRAMPGHGKVGLFFGSWYTRAIIGRVMKTRKKKLFAADLARIRRFEQLLVDDGTLLVKLWLHLPKDAQRERLKELERLGRLGPDDWKHFRRYDRFRAVSEAALEATHTEAAPWLVLDARDRHHRELVAGRALLQVLRRRPGSGSQRATETATGAEEAATVATPESVLPAPVGKRRAMPKSSYARQLERLQGQLSQLAWQAHAAGRATVLAFEGWDAAGKGSAIRRLTQAMDPRLYRVVGIAAPTDEERRQHYLWRFWRRMPRDGQMTIFDRSWYGRVLVERVEGFATPAQWGRAYDEINDLEAQLTWHGVTFAKFWLEVSPAEQLRRFKERERVPWKRHKITDEDWRNRERYADYRVAVDEMLARCSPPAAPWTVVAADDKRRARLHVLETVIDRLAQTLER